MNDSLATGKCGAAFGLKGAVKLTTDNTAENLKKAGRLSLRKNGADFTLEVENAWLQGNVTYIKFRGIDTREDASKILTNAEVFIDRKYASPLSKGCVYCSDLVGLDVINQTQKVGKVISWLDATGNIMLEIETLDQKKHIIPYQKAFFAEPDLKSGSIEILNTQILI